MTLADLVVLWLAVSFPAAVVMGAALRARYTRHSSSEPLFRTRAEVGGRSR
jgi:hypothetical protein